MAVQEIIFTVNGPGELNGVVLPLAEEFKKRWPAVVRTLFVVPCQYASGEEPVQALKSGLFNNVFSAEQYKKYWLKKELPPGYAFKEKSIVFYGGGDGVHAIRLSERNGFDAYAYTADDKNLSKKTKFKLIFRPEVDGDLMVDAAQKRGLVYQDRPIGAGTINVGLYPGSRPKHREVMVPFLKETAEVLNKKYPNLNFVWGLTEQELAAYGLAGAAFEKPGMAYNLVICLVGTNTAITGALGIPMLVLLPFNYPELIPFMGVFGLLAEIPFLGKLLKKLAILLIKNKVKLVALPNIKAARTIVPELKGYLTPQQVAESAESLLLNMKERRQIHDNLKIFMGDPGAAQNIAEKFEEVFY